MLIKDKICKVCCLTVNKSPKQSKANSELYLLCVMSVKPGPDLADSSFNLYKISIIKLNAEYLVSPSCSFCRISSRLSFNHYKQKITRFIL